MSLHSTVVLLSGGMDSATLLWHAVIDGPASARIHAVSFDYGQRHKQELGCAINLVERAREVFPSMEFHHTVLNMGPLSRVMAGSSQTSPEIPVPHGHYAAENMKQTVVPNRNMVMLSLAGALAIQEKAEVLAYAAHAGDHAIYPDCRPDFVEGMAQAFLNCDWNPLNLWTPFLLYTKGDIARLGKTMNVPYEMTWSCYEGGHRPCGRCGTCVERAEAFAEAGFPDPLL